MTKHKVYVKRRRRNLGDKSLALMVRRCVLASLTAAGVNVPCVVDILLTDRNQIRSINAAQRNIDKETDVLSFPSFDFIPGSFETNESMFDLELGRVFLGDIVVSVNAVAAQAKEYNHSEERELAYLTVHAVLHLLGYDHENEDDKKTMREKEEEILDILDFRR